VRQHLAGVGACGLVVRIGQSDVAPCLCPRPFGTVAVVAFGWRPWHAVMPGGGYCISRRRIEANTSTLIADTDAFTEADIGLRVKVFGAVL